MNKLLLRVGETSLVRRTAAEIAKLNLSEMVAVTGFEHDKIKKELKKTPFKIAYNEDHLTGMHTSIKKGLSSLRGECDAFFVCLSDQPYFTAQTLQILIDACEKSASRKKVFYPTFNGERGQPVLIGAEFIKEILAHEDGDHGCNYLFERYPDLLQPVPIDSDLVLKDIDHLQDYEDYLEQNT